MPRPGPRPYECVRRAWHSERHHPIRGSLIQEIFRIANEIHSSTTKKKKEWQEKLPTVVLKAEEIMYSKANSEAEYMDLKTLWDRAHDAINTIIRREEGSEDTGEFLQPCIEAALHLGCVPRRASRSQRNNNPRGYLTGNPDLANAREGNPMPTSTLVPHYPNVLGKEPHNHFLPIKSCLNNETFLASQNGFPCQGSFPSHQSYAVYPLYYGAYTRPMEPRMMLGDQPTSNFINNNHPEVEISRNFSSCNEKNEGIRSDLSKVPMNNPPNNECDLSLRLGFPSMQDDEDVVVGSKKKLKETLSLYHDGSSVSRNDETLDVNLMLRKRKAVGQMKDPRLSWEPKFLPSYSNERTSTAG